MKNTIISFLKNHYDCLTQLYTSVIAFVIFVSGIGRFTSMLFLAIFFLIYALLLIYGCNIESIKKAYVPIILGFIYFDIKHGPVLPVFTFNNILIAFTAYFCLKWLLASGYKRAIERLTDYVVFTCCPRCNCETNNFVTECANCGHSASNLSGEESQKISRENDGLLEAGEVIKQEISLGFFSGASIYRNDMMLDFTNLVITNKRIILVTKQFFQRGISNKDEVLLSKIIDSHIDQKKHHGLEMKMIVFSDNENKYELYQILKRKSEDLSPIVESIFIKA